MYAQGSLIVTRGKYSQMRSRKSAKHWCREIEMLYSHILDIFNSIAPLTRSSLFNHPLTLEQFYCVDHGFFRAKELALYSLAHLIGRLARSLGRDRRGSVYAFVGIALIPLLAAMGIGIDAGRGYLVRARLSQALDAAALADGREFSSTARAGPTWGAKRW
jgi:hypothetical protein